MEKKISFNLKSNNLAYSAVKNQPTKNLPSRSPIYSQSSNSLPAKRLKRPELTLIDLPDKILVHIFTFLDYSTFLQVAIVSVLLNSLKVVKRMVAKME